MNINPYKFISAGVLWTFLSWLPVFKNNTNPMAAFISFPSDAGIFLEQYVPMRTSYLLYAFLFSLVICIGINLCLYRIIALFLVEQKHKSSKRSD